MNNEIDKINATPFTQERADRIAELEARVAALEKQMLWSNQWADTWAKEQVHLGLIVKQFHLSKLTEAEVQRFRDFMNKYLDD